MSTSYTAVATRTSLRSGETVCPSFLHTIHQLDILIEVALDNMLSVVGAHAGSLFLWDEFQKTFTLKSSRGPYRDRMNHTQVKLRQGILGTIGDGGASVLVKDLGSDNRFQDKSRFNHYRSSSFICIPLIAQNKLIGIVSVTERESLVAFSEEDLNLADTFGRHVAVAIENARMMQKLHRDNDKLHHESLMLRQHVKDQESLVSVGKLATNLTHELNNPLDAIRRYVNLALDQSMEDSLTREYLVKAKKGIRRAIGVIRGLLHYSRELHQTGTRTAELHQILRETISSFDHKILHKNIQLEENFTPKSLLVHDRGLPLVFKNLYRNAIDAMAGKGTVKISTLEENGTVIVYVEDTGHGIAQRDLERIFEPFFTTKSEGKGTGVGLTFCREIIEKSGGSIQCESKPGQGTRFCIKLPCVQ